MVEKCLGHQRIAAATLASSTAPTIPTGTREMWVSCDTNNVRMTLDGTTPTSTNGMQIIAGTNLPIKVTLAMGLHSAKFILESGTPNLTLTYFGQSDN